MFSNLFNQLLRACETGDVILAHALIPLVDCRECQSAPLRTAALHNHTQLVLDLLPHSDPSAVEHDALRQAISHNNSMLIETLLPGCNPLEAFQRCSIFMLCGMLGREELFTHIARECGPTAQDYDRTLKFSAEQNATPKPMLSTLPHILPHCTEKTLQKIFKQMLERRCLEWVEGLLPAQPHRILALARLYMMKSELSKAHEVWRQFAASNLPVVNQDYYEFLDHCVYKLYPPLLKDILTPPWRAQSLQHEEVLETVVLHKDPALLQEFIDLGFKVNSGALRLAAKTDPQITTLLLNAHKKTSDTIDSSVAIFLAMKGALQDLRSALEFDWRGGPYAIFKDLEESFAALKYSYTAQSAECWGLLANWWGNRGTSSLPLVVEQYKNHSDVVNALVPYMDQGAFEQSMQHCAQGDCVESVCVLLDNAPDVSLVAEALFTNTTNPTLTEMAVEKIVPHSDLFDGNPYHLERYWDIVNHQQHVLLSSTVSEAKTQNKVRKI